MRVHPHIPVGEIAASMPHVTKLFDVLGVDYVLHGDLSLRDACGEAGIDPALVKSSIEALPRNEGEQPHWEDANLRDLLAFMEKHRHARLRATLTEFSALLAAAAPGEPGMSALRETFTTLFIELEPHLLREERLLFPLIRVVEEVWTNSRAAAQRPAEEVAGPVASLKAEHVVLLDAMKDVRTSAAALRDDGGICTRILDAVAELNHELRDHIHLQNNVLFPRATALEQAVNEMR